MRVRVNALVFYLFCNTFQNSRIFQEKAAFTFSASSCEVIFGLFHAIPEVKHLPLDIRQASSE